MCIAAAVPLLSIGVGVAQAAMGYQAQSQAAARQNQIYAENARSAQKAAVGTYAAQQNQLLQKRAAAGQDVTEARIQGIQARGTARNAAGEAGVTGLSVDALINDYYGREGRRIDSINQNYSADRDYLRAQMEATEAQTKSRINSVQRAEGPSFADAAIRMAGAVVGGLGQMGRGSLSIDFGSTSSTPWQREDMPLW